MRIALIISGCYRAFQYNTHLYNTIQHYDIDTFVTLSRNHSTPENLKSFASLYHVKRLEIHGKSIDDLIPPGITRKELEDRTHPETNFYDCLSMFYCHYNTLQMIKQYEIRNNFAYDVVIYACTDGMFPYLLPLPYISDLKKNTMYIPEGDNRIGLCHRDTLETYCSLYLDFVKYVLRDNVSYHLETLLLHHLLQKKLNISRFPFRCVLHNLRHA
jgi:hypothetical protein